MGYKDPERQKKYQREYQAYHRHRYAEAMRRFKDYLGGKCVRCGSADRLEFDHVDPETKLFSIARKWKLPFGEIKEELDKCQLLCHECHLDKTYPLRNRR